MGKKNKRAYRTEHVATTPRGWKVRTSVMGKHVVRLAVPPGPRRRGAAKVVQVLHPKGENPQCTRKQRNSLVEAALAGAVGAAAGGTAAVLTERWLKGRKKVKASNAKGRKTNAARTGGAYVIKWEDGGISRTFRTKGAADRFLRATKKLKGTVVWKSARETNPNNGAASAAKKAYQEFHGRPPEQVSDFQEELLKSGDYWAIGKLAGLWLSPVGKDFHKWPAPDIEFDPEENVMVVAEPDPKKTQFYIVGGDQKLSREDLNTLSNGADTSKRFVPLGCVYAFGYFARKAFDNFEQVQHMHRFGEETGELPLLYYDKEAARLVLVGGAYSIAPPEGKGSMRISPGVVN